MSLSSIVESYKFWDIVTLKKQLDSTNQALPSFWFSS